MSWYLIYTKPHAESQAQENLERQGFATYLPLLKGSRRRSRKYIDVVEPLFPRYLFIELNKYSHNWSPIRSTFGVAKLVSFGEKPTHVPFGVIDFLKQNEDERGLHQFHAPEFSIGDKVVITDGPGEGLEGMVMARNGRDRVKLLLDAVSFNPAVTVARGSISLVK